MDAAPITADSPVTPSRRSMQRLVRRLGVHKRRMRYWANLPGMYGPTGKQLRRADEMYELACDDADSIAHEIEKLTGSPCAVVDIRRTFQARWSNPKAPAVMLRGSANAPSSATTPSKP